MIKTDKNKRGFSLVEALVSMLILSVFFAATAKVWSKRQKPESPKYPHGYFECYYDGTTLKQGLGKEQQSPDTTNAPNGKCTFEAQGGNIIYKVLVIYATPSAYNSDLGCGGSVLCGGISEMFPFIAGTLTMTPPKNSSSQPVNANSLSISNTNTGNNEKTYYSLPEDKNISYAQLNNYISFTNSKCNILNSNAGNTEYNGGILISW